MLQFCEKLGWKGNNGKFDVLPIILSNDGNPKYYQLPDEIISKVQIKHPSIKAIDDLNLQWFGVPMVSGMLFEVGGLQFPAVPFNGWFVSVEILRNLMEPSRFALQKVIADAIGCSTTSNLTLWKDKVALELNTALLHSFNLAGVTLVDQHTVSEQFADHFKNEMAERGGCPADWVWLVPSQSGSLTPLYHQEFLNYHLSPSFEKQDNLWEAYLKSNRTVEKYKFKIVALAVRFLVYASTLGRKQKPQIRLFFATETGTAKRFTYTLKQVLSRAFDVEIIGLDKFNKDLFTGICMFVVATAGEGNAPAMADGMTEWLRDQVKTCIDESNNRSAVNHLIKGFKYGVFALGNSSYQHFCGFGKWLDESLETIGGTRMLAIGLGDELKDRGKTFKEWSNTALKQSSVYAGVAEPDQLVELGKDAQTRWRKSSDVAQARPLQSRIDGAAERKLLSPLSLSL